MAGNQPASEAAGAPAARLGRRDLLLIALSLSAGVVDALSVAVLGVFTGAITGDVVLLGRSLGDGASHDALHAAVALAGFAAGVFLALRALRALGGRAAGVPLVLAVVVALQGAFLALWAAAGASPGAAALAALTALSAVAMGAQTAATRTLHPHGPPTTYVTGTLTVLVSELAGGSGSRADRLRRGGVVVAIAAGAALGAAVLLHARVVAAAIPPAITAAVALAAVTLPPPPPRSVGRGR